MILRLMIGASAIYWFVMAIAPVSRSTWLLENMMTAIGMVLLVVFWREKSLSRASMVMALIFLMLHTTGAHYTYSLVPYDVWSQSLLGHSVSEMTGWPRNEYDRWVHFAFGALLANAWHDWLVRSGRATSRAAWWITLLIIMSISHLYELIEWGAAEIFGGDLGTAYVGAQGDEWDAQKDMALATAGAFVGVTLGLMIRTSPDSPGLPQ